MSKKPKVKAVIKDRYPEKKAPVPKTGFLKQAMTKLGDSMKAGELTVSQFKHIWETEHKGKVFAPEDIKVSDLTARQVELLVTRVLNDTDVHQGKDTSTHKGTVAEMIPILYGNWTGEKDGLITQNEEFYQYLKGIIATYLHGAPTSSMSVGLDTSTLEDHTSYTTIKGHGGGYIAKTPFEDGMIHVLEQLHSQIENNLEGLAPTSWHQVIMDSIRAGGLPVPTGQAGEYWGENGWNMYVKGLAHEQAMLDILVRDLQRMTFMFKPHRISVPDLMDTLYHQQSSIQDAFVELCAAWRNLVAMYNVLPKKGVQMKQSLILAWELILVQAFWNGGNVLIQQVRMLSEPLYQFLNVHQWELPSEIETDMIGFIQKTMDCTLPVYNGFGSKGVPPSSGYIPEPYKAGGVVISKGKHYWQRLASPHHFQTAYTKPDIGSVSMNGEAVFNECLETYTVYCNEHTPFAWTLDKVH
ncbi:hypothetical protein VH22019_00047 [Vibrio phage VH2_2019]|nr:hypothetical protein VH22019_00047 [Vibrio phage VH2_2019]